MQVASLGIGVLTGAMLLILTLVVKR